MSQITNLHFWRQHFILLSVLICNFSKGFIMAFPSVLNPSILALNGTDIRATAEQASWIASSSGISGMPAFIILPIIMERFGRRITSIVVNFCMIFGWVIFFFAQDTVALLTARIIHGVGLGAALIGEYSDPKRRGYFMVSTKLMIAVGITLCHILYLNYYWRDLSKICFAVNLISLIMTFMWPESPAYLVVRNRFHECEESFVWLHGRGNNTIDLKNMIQTQKEKNKESDIKKRNFKNIVRRFLDKDSLKSYCISVLLIFLLEASGRHYFAAYLMQMILDLLGEKALSIYVTICNDLVAMFGVLISVVVVNYFKRRTLLFTLGSLSVLLTIAISVTLFIKSYPWCSVSLVLIFSLVANIGIVPIAFALMGEVYPLDLKGFGVSISGFSFSLIVSIYLKITPFFIEHTGPSGTFLINSGVAAFSLMILYFILPETKDRTLLDIEFDLKGEKRKNEKALPMLLK